ncbi:MAG: hydrogenase expression/formation C-terminal domain-containing protein [Gammaproteobacteria bacterium]|nr:hydrogenase expression/formation C-terminal domain-containing protein [Gammaproteobacteria bacterium]
MHEFPDIPIVEIGPGSQTRDADDSLEYMSMPEAMQTYHRPILPEPEDVAGIDVGRRVLGDVGAALRAWQPGMPAALIDLDALDAASLAFVNQALGEGEVSITLDGPAPVRVQESVLAGVWRVRHLDAQERVVRDTIEVGDVPELVRNATFADAALTLDTAVYAYDPEIQNAPALLVEVADRLASQRPGDPAHAVNLSLLPLSDADLVLLGERLGVGPVTILSRGYGNCRIGSTATRNVWWIKYFNSQDALILNTIEVTDVPAVALAAAEDVADSRERLDEILELYR